MKENTPIKTDYIPAKNYLMIEPEKESEVSEGGIIIPASAREYLLEGKIIAMGPDVDRSILKEGMYVTFSKHSEFALEVEDKQIIFAVAEDNIILYRYAKPNLFPVDESLPLSDSPFDEEEYKKQSRARCGKHDLQGCKICFPERRKGNKKLFGGPTQDTVLA